jgi:DNA-binding CsgD family transcriptional regulator
MIALAPPIEAWAKGNRVLRRCRLANDDDARAVMVDALERLAADDYANLRKFLTRQTIESETPDLVAEVVRLGRLDDDEDDVRDDDRGTPLRAWLLRLVDFASRDHVRRRLGWGVDHDRLTSREREVLGELTEGHTTQTIATRLGIGFGTVQTHLKYRKLDVGSKAAATAIALRHQLV